MPLTRRTLLMAPAAGWLMQAAQAAVDHPDPYGTVLVVLQLAGGNDGLNTVVPYQDDQYARARSTLRLGAGQVLKIGAGLGFHPELRGFARLLQAGRLAVLQGVGYPHMHRDHNIGMRNWQTASPIAAGQTGWLGRAADRASDPGSGNVPAVFVGEIAQPLSIRARQVVVPAIAAAEDWTLAASAAVPDAGRANPLANFAARTSTAAFADACRLDAVLHSSGPRLYPQFPLAQSFQTVARLMRAEMGIRIFLVELGGPSPGGFDNHSNQAGNHAAILRELSESVAAFCDDLAQDRLLDRMLLMTYSEFGRQLTENGRHGTGHGAAAPVFLAGGKVKGGLVGAHPGLSDLDDDAPKPHTDFRAVYATALDRWLGMPSRPILGQDFQPLDVLG